MPGRTPAEAVSNFLEPLKTATSCLGPAKLVLSGRQPGRTQVWSLNADGGMVFTGGMHFEAQMHFEVIRSGADWRVTTRAYRYRVAIAGSEVFLMHWHPTGNSPYKLPHVHLPGMTGASGETHHLPSPRMTYEHAIAWAIEGDFVPPARHDWRDALDDTLQRHIRYRTWNNDPSEAEAASQ